MKTSTGQQEQNRQESQDRTDTTGWSDFDSKDRTDGTRELGTSAETGRIRREQPGQDSQKERTGRPKLDMKDKWTGGTGQPHQEWQESNDWTTGTGSICRT